jgi:hypothetical protein
VDRVAAPSAAVTHRPRVPRHCYLRSAAGLLPGGVLTAADARQSMSKLQQTLRTGCLDDKSLVAATRLKPRDLKRLDRFAKLAVGAARITLAAAGLSDIERETCGVVVGNMTAGWTFTEPELRKLHASGVSDVSPYLASAWFPAAAQGQITIHLGLQGYAKTFATDRCAGGQAIGHAYDRIRYGQDELLLAGGTEAPVTPFVEAAYGSAFGDTTLLCEASAFVLLSSLPAPAAEHRMEIKGHLTRPLFSEEKFQTQVAQALDHCLEDSDCAEPDVVLVNTLASAQLEQQIAAALRSRPGCNDLNIQFVVRELGDALAACAPLAAVRAAEILQTGEAQCVAVFSVGHQCLDVLLLTSTAVSPQ